MRRSNVFVVVAVIGVFLASAAPAGGGAVEKTEYYGIECVTADFTEAAFNAAGNTIHFRGGQGDSEEWLWIDDDWVPVGTNATVINSNQNLKNNTGANWGTFALDLGDIGSFEGSWAGGKATGSATDDNGMLFKGDLAPDLGDFPPLPGLDFCGDIVLFPPVLEFPPLPVKYTIINPHA